MIRTISITANVPSSHELQITLPPMFRWDLQRLSLSSPTYKQQNSHVGDLLASEFLECGVIVMT